MPELNHEHIQSLIDILKVTSNDRDTGFDMSRYVHNYDTKCQTPSCMAGWAIWDSEGRPEYIKTLWYNCFSTGRNWLGLSGVQAHALFVPWETVSAEPYDTSDIRTDQAIKVLEHLLETGEVDWAYAELPPKLDADYEGAY